MLLYGGCCSGGWGGTAAAVVMVEEVVEGMAAMVGCGGLWCRAANAANTSTSIGTGQGGGELTMQQNSPVPVLYLVRAFADVARDKKGGRCWKTDPDWVHRWELFAAIGGSAGVASSVGPVGDGLRWCGPVGSSVEAPFPVGLLVCCTCANEGQGVCGLPSGTFSVW